jgi:hypothetical protein
MATVFEYAPTKGESQVAFHMNATELFSLGDTNPDKKDPSARRGYGQRNKSYMFKENGICSLDNPRCACSDVEDGNEEDIKGLDLDMNAYGNSCGLVLRLWNYPTSDVIHTGLSAAEEKGFFCFYQENKQQIASHTHHHIECSILHDAVRVWKMKPLSEKTKYKARSEICKADYHLIYLNESCFRYNDRQIAQTLTAINIESMYSTVQRTNAPVISLCPNLGKPGKKYLIAFDEITLMTERVKYKMTKESMNVSVGLPVSSAHDPPDPNNLRLVEYVDNIIQKAEYCLKLGPYMVTNKTRLPEEVQDPRYYFSEKSKHWRLADLTEEMQFQLANHELEQKGDYVISDSNGAPGTVIGGPHEDYYDKAKAWYMINNVTTLALAWFFTGQIQYAEHGALLVRTFFLDDKVGMHPSLSYAQNGARAGLLDWKDFYVLMDAIVLFEWSGMFTAEDQQGMRIWCKELTYWYMMSPQGRETGRALNNHGVIFDLSVLSLATYARIEPAADMARNRLHYRLSQPAPLGQFALSGEPYYEVGKPTAFHDATVTLASWLHVASVVEAVRANDQPRGAMESLWWVRHVGEDTSSSSTSRAPPVLLKAVQWLLRYLPSDPQAYTQYSDISRPNVEPDSLNGNIANNNVSAGIRYIFPYDQRTPYAYDRLLEILHMASKIYSMNRIFPKEELLRSDQYARRVAAATMYPIYNVHVATFTNYSSVDPASATRIWGELGVLEKRILN